MTYFCKIMTCLILSTLWWQLSTASAQSRIVPSSVSQMRCLNEHGKPEQFLVVYMYLDPDPVSGLPRLLKNPRRIEHWFYGSKGLRVMFDQGFVVRTTRFNPAILGSLPKSAYEPLVFDERTMPADIIALLGKPDNTETAATPKNIFTVYRYLKPGAPVYSFTFLNDRLIAFSAGLCIAPGAGTETTRLKPRAQLGVFLGDLSEKERRAFKLSQSTKGALVVSMVPGGSAAKAGLKNADLIISFEGKQVSSAASLIRFVSQCRPGQIVYLQIVRQGVLMKLPVKLEAVSSAKH